MHGVLKPIAVDVPYTVVDSVSESRLERSERSGLLSRLSSLCVCPLTSHHCRYTVAVTSAVSSHAQCSRYVRSYRFGLPTA